MREGWEIKKLGEICKLYQPKTISNKEFVEDGKYPVYGSNGIIGQYNQYNHAEREILISCRGTCGRVNVSRPYSWVNGNAMVIHINQPEIGFDFLKYQLMAVDMSEVITGAAIPQITRQSLVPIKIAIPPVQEQEKIVAELDCLSAIIEKKKQQLEELDKLAQSIFYDMFGDPIANERGWEVKSLEKVVHKECPISYGIVQPMEDVQDGVPIVRPIDLTETFIKPDGLKKTAREISNSYKRTILRGDEILVCVRGTTGVVACADITLRGCNTTRGITPLFFDERNERWFMFSLFRAPSFRHLIEEKTYGIALKQINIRDLKLLPIIQPSVSMQQLFARKVEAIERQRELVKRSIGETETLFNSRMDYWFN